MQTCLAYVPMSLHVPLHACISACLHIHLVVSLSPHGWFFPGVCVRVVFLPYVCVCVQLSTCASFAWNDRGSSLLEQQISGVLNAPCHRSCGSRTSRHADSRRERARQRKRQSQPHVAGPRRACSETTGTSLACAKTARRRRSRRRQAPLHRPRRGLGGMSR